MSVKQKNFKPGDKVFAKEYRSWGECEIVGVRESSKGGVRYSVRISPYGMWYNISGTALEPVRKRKRRVSKRGSSK